MPFARFILCFVFLLFGGATFAEEAQPRVALVIGNSAYHRTPLANPVNDARLIAAKLRAQGFEVFDFYNASQRDMKRAVQSFAATLRQRGKDAAAFIFYAGHGVQVKGENYLIPVDEHIASEADVDIDAVSLSSIMSMLENSEARLSIVVLDACRDNPFGHARGGSRGLARVDAPSGSLVAFSTSPGKVAVDGPAGGNSFYTAALAQAMAEPGLKIEEVFKRVRIAVREQTPWESTSLTGDFYPAQAQPTQAEPPQPNPQTVVAKSDLMPLPRSLRQIFIGHTGSVDSVAILPDGRTALSGSDDRTLRLWDIASGRVMRSLSGNAGEVQSVAVSPDGRMALSGGEDKTLRLWDINSGHVLRSFKGHTDGIQSIAFSLDGRTALSGSNDKTIKLWDIATGRELRSFKGHTGSVWSVALAPDGRTMLSGGEDKTLRLWDIASGRVLRVLAGHTDYVTSVAFFPDGRTALSGSRDKTLKLWDIAGGGEMRTFTGHTDYVLSIAISPDGRTALSGSQDKTLKLWDIASGLVLQTFAGHADHVWAVAFSPDGRTALSGSEDKTLKLWDVSEWTQPQEARR